jgi:ribosomal protein S18 acetylase RimI-like enzyme
MKILEAKKEDIPTLLQLINEVQELHINWDSKKYKKIKKYEVIEWLRKLLDDKNVKILIASENSKAIGYVIAKIHNREENAFIYPAQLIEIDQICVAEKYRNKGVGKRLVDEVKSYAKKLGIDTLFLFVLDKNSDAIRAYTKMGFKTAGRRMFLNIV